MMQRTVFMFLAMWACVFGLVALETGCSDKALTTVAKASADIAAANSSLGLTLINAAQSGALTADQVRPILQVTLTVAQVDQKVNQAISGLTALTPAQKTSILAQLQLVVQAVNDGITQTNLITNQTLKTSIMASLTTIQAALAVAMGML
jgi:hypothetical protein